MAGKRGNKKLLQQDDQQSAATVLVAPAERLEVAAQQDEVVAVAPAVTILETEEQEDAVTAAPAQTDFSATEPAATISVAPAETLLESEEQDEAVLVAPAQTDFSVAEPAETVAVAKAPEIDFEEAALPTILVPESEPTQTARQEKVGQDEGVLEEGEESFIHDPWGPVLSLASAAATLSKMPAMPPQRRFTRNRVFLFVALVLLVVVLFVGGGFALLAVLAPQTNAVQIIQPTQTIQQPTQQGLRPMQTMMTPLGPGQRIVDNFQRQADIQAGWGTANGQPWQVTSPQRAASFSVVGNVGMITSPATQQGGLFYTAIIGPTNAVEASVTFAMQFNAQQFGIQQPANFGVLLRWQDADNYDKAYVDGSQLIILENRAGQQTMLARTVFSAVSGNAYTIRFRVDQTLLQAKAWPSTQGEPALWMLTSNSNLMAGQAGIRALLLPSSKVQVTSFAAQLATA